MNRKKLRRLHDRRAVNAVISNIILTAAVITAGFVVLAWTQYRASSYNQQYGEAMDSDLARLKESLVFECVFFNRDEQNLSVYVMNSGTIDNVTVQTLHVTNNTWHYTSSSISLKFLNGTAASSLSRGSEGYFRISSLNLVENSTYSIVIVTGRGSHFDTTYNA